MAERTDSSGGMMAVVAVLIVLFLLILLPFVPLLLAMAEALLFGTRQVENFCEQIGIHDELGMLYEPVIEFLTGR